MKPLAVRIDYDETDNGKFKVTVSYHERDAPDTLGRSVDIVVYVDAAGRTLPQAASDISAIGVASARKFLEKILAES
jgi:hypothetical protein